MQLFFLFYDQKTGMVIFSYKTNITTIKNNQLQSTQFGMPRGIPE